ncbi:MAG: AAA family ATPase [Deltaproteobacteria bacterium]|nr:AAA family ATPase [Deltaproteobacteria bacterium]
MECPRCRFQNREGAKFCKECGCKFQITCPACNTVNPFDSKFCDECGHDLTAASSESPQQPEPIPAAQIITGPERKYITVLFSDLSGYTAMTERLDPEEVGEIMGRIFGEIAQVVVKYGGFIEKFVGDAVMALFGVPRVHEDDPVRAIRAALEIHEVVKAIGVSFETRIGKPLTMHTGINTGLVITGELDLEKGTPGVLGDTINVASRLQGLARADEVIVGFETYHRTEGYFDFETLTPATVKGKAEPIRIYKVLSTKEAPIKVHRLSGMRADLIGRKVEMERLQEAVEQLKQGRGSIFSIVGDAGTGKTRLIEEFKSSLEPGSVQWREGHAYAYAQNIPYFPLIDLLNRTWHIQESDTTGQVRKKVEAGARAIIGERRDLIPSIGSLYALSYPETEQLSPETWKARLHEAVQLILANLCGRAPTIIRIEDLHQADPSTIELLKKVLTDFRHPAIFLCIHRPPFSLFTAHQMKSLRSYHEIRLQDLSPSESRDMVESLLDTRDIPAELSRFVQDKAEGNPFYLEEAINALIESDTLVREDARWRLTKPLTDADIPYTVQEIIAARLDRLERETKRILQEASVIGRAFLYDILGRITELRESIDRSLSSLERLDLIQARAIQPDLEYMFKHALTQEVVYNGILKKDRQFIHERIGQVMEELFHDRLPEFYETLAYHFRQGRSLLKAVDYLMKAGKKSFSRYAIDEAHAHYREAYELLSGKPDRTREENELLIDLIFDWAFVFHHRSVFHELLDLLTDIESLVISLGDTNRLGMFHIWKGAALQRTERYLESYEHLSQAHDIAHALGDKTMCCYACGWLVQTCYGLGRLDDALELGEKGRELDVCEHDRVLHQLLMGAIGSNYYLRGEGGKAHEIGDILLDYGHEHSDMGSIAHGHMCHGFGYLVQGNYPNAIASFEKQSRASCEPMFLLNGKFFLGTTYLFNSQYAEAENVLNEVNEYFEKHGYEYLGSASRAFSGMLMIVKGEFEQGIAVVENVLKEYLRQHNWYRFAVVNHSLGKVYLQLAQLPGGETDLAAFGGNAAFLKDTLPTAHETAAEYFMTAIEKAGEIGAKSVHGQACLDMGRLHKLKGKKEEAAKYLTEATHIFEQIGAEIFLKQAQEESASL